MKIFKVILISIIGFFSISSFAWREGNGGVGVVIGEKLYLLDLVESGIEQSLMTEAQISNHFFEKEIIAWSNSQSVSVPRQLIINKLAQIQRKNSVMAYLILMSLKTDRKSPLQTSFM